MLDFDRIFRDSQIGPGCQARKRGVRPYTFAVCVFLLWPACLDFNDFLQLEARLGPEMFDFNPKCYISIGF